MTLALAASLVPTARADVLWYNGDYDNTDSLLNVNNAKINVGGTIVTQNSLVYENFVVPVNQVWTVTGVFSNNDMSFYSSPTTATWQIRSGVSLGNGGTLIASGDTAATYTTLTKTPGYYYAGTPTKVAATVGSVVLTAGTYWVAVAPDSGSYYDEQSFVFTTSGQNAVGTPAGVGGNSFYSYTGPNGTTTFASAFGYDFSLGVTGTIQIVPAPPSLVLMGIGLAGTALRKWKLRRRGPAVR